MSQTAANLWSYDWTNARLLRRESADLLASALWAIAHPVLCPPERVDLLAQPVPEPEDHRREIRSGVCGRCGCRHSWPRNGGGGRRLYCDACKRY